MHWFTAIVLFVMIWWTVLFAVLPFGVRPVADPDTATGWRGAPARPMMWRKVVMTTLISAGLWGMTMAVIRSDLISFRSEVVTGD